MAFAAAPELSVFAVTVAACPPLAPLLAVELLNRALKRHRAETSTEPAETTSSTDTWIAETDETDETGPVVRLAVVPNEPNLTIEPTAEQRMWAYYQTERSQDCAPTGTELDRTAGHEQLRPSPSAAVATAGPHNG